MLKIDLWQTKPQSPLNLIIKANSEIVVKIKKCCFLERLDLRKERKSKKNIGTWRSGIFSRINIKIDKL